jgi:hypothetical protein
VRALTIVNGSLWSVLFIAWVPYTVRVGWTDPTSSEVRWILATTAVLMVLLGFLRVRRHRPVLG